MCENLGNCVYFESTFNTSPDPKVHMRVWRKYIPLKNVFPLLVLRMYAFYRVHYCGGNEIKVT